MTSQSSPENAATDTPPRRASVPLPMIDDGFVVPQSHTHALDCACCSHTAPTTSGAPSIVARLDGAARSEKALLVGALLGAAGWILALSRDTQAGHNTASIPFYLAVVLLGGWPLLRGAGRAWKTRSLDMNALMSAAVIGAGALGEWGEAAALVWLYALAEKIENRSLSRAQSAITSLLTLAPSRVLVRRSSGSSNAELQEIDAASVRVGETFVTRAGERIALDGALLSNWAQLDESPITGESLPVERRAGDEVLAGTLNLGDAFDARVLRPASEGTSARIARLVEEAGAHASPRQRATERFARRYTPFVFAGAILAALVPPLALGASWNDSIYRALALLVAACPCAFVLGGPVATWCALAALSRRGVLARGGAALESLAAAQSFAFDKTGTLTRGTPVVTDFVEVGLSSTRREDLIAIAAGLEARSTHPLARAVLDFAQNQNIAPAPVMRATERRGVGVRGTVAGERFRIERFDVVDESGAARDAAQSLIERGRTVALLSRENDGKDELLALLGFVDETRPEARRALEELRELGVRECIVLSGDNPNVVSRVAQEVGASAWRAELKPEEKLQIVREWERGGTLAMVGDGINDAPALAGASVGVAMGGRGAGGASDVALEASGVALLRDDLRLLPAAVRLARRAQGVVTANIVLALGLKGGFVIGVLLGVWGEDYLVGGVISDVGASLLVTLNGLRLLRDSEARNAASSGK